MGDFSWKIDTTKSGNMNTEGCIYVVRASSKVVKIGKSTNPRSRIAAHRSSIECWGLELTDNWVSERHEGYSKSETLLLGWAHRNPDGELFFGAEYFSGLNFSRAVWAARAVVAHVDSGLDLPWKMSFAPPKGYSEQQVREMRAAELRAANAWGLSQTSTFPEAA